MSSDDNDERVLKRLTVRELREKAVKALGSKVAAGLKLKQELVDALTTRVTAKKKAAKTPPRPTATKVKTAKAAPAPKASPAKRPAVSRPATPRVSAPVAAKPSKAAAVAAAGELPIARDFFLDPRRPHLPTSYGDDRLLCFRREPLAVMVSWDLSAATFGDGQGLELEVISVHGKLVGSAPIAAATGLATFEALPEGKALTVQVVRKGKVMTRARPFMLGAERSDDVAYQMTVPFDRPLTDPERRVWGDAPHGAARARGRRASSSRLSS